MGNSQKPLTAAGAVTRRRQLQVRFITASRRSTKCTRTSYNALLMASSREDFCRPQSTEDLCRRLSLAVQPSKQDAAERQPTARSTKELQALQALQQSMINEFIQSPSEAHAIEITSLAPFLDEDDYVRVFDKFHNVIASAAVDGKIVDVELLRAFEAFLHCHQAGLAGKRLNLGSAMLSIQKALDSAVDAAHGQTKYNSIRALSAALDAMNEVKVEGIIDLKVQNLLKRLEKLRDHKELRLAEVASYSYQALLAIPTDVSPWKKIGASTFKTILGGAKVAGSVWSLDPSKLVEGLVDLTEVPELISSIIEVIKSCSELFQSASNAGKAFKTLKKPKDWYVALRATDGLVWANAPKHLEALLQHPDLPCRADKDFLCGLCAQLELADDLKHGQVFNVLKTFLITQASQTKFCRVLEWARLVTRSPQLDSPNLSRSGRRKTYLSDVECSKPKAHQPRKQLLDNAWKSCHKVREFYGDQVLRDKYTDPDLNLLKIERLDSSKLSMDKCYINLAIARNSVDSNRNGDSDTRLPSPFSILRRLDVWEPPETDRVSLETLFDEKKDTPNNILRGPPRRILIRGQAGVGKTTLCKKMVYDFIHKDMWARIIDRVIWVPLRQIKSNLESGQSIADILNRSLPDVEKAGKGTLGEALERSFTDDPSRTLFILDGFDEVHRELHTPGNELLLKLLNQPRVIVTTRPRGVNREVFQKIDLEVETIGFYPNQVKEYIKKYGSGKAKEIYEFIEGHPVVAGLARIPIQLDAICYSMIAGMLDGDSPPETMTELYHAIERSLWNKDVESLEKRREGSTEPLLKHEAQASYSDDIRRLCQAEINALQSLSFTGLCNNMVEFDPAFLTKFHSQQSIIAGNLPMAKMQPWFTDLDRVSFLRTSDGPLTPTTRSYHFLHLTFQELFAAQFFVQHWISRKHLVVFDYSTKKSTPTKPETFLRMEKYNSSYDVFWRFVAGTIQLQRDEEALKRFFQTMEEEPKDLLGPAHLRFTMHCLAEINSSAFVPPSFVEIRQSLELKMMDWLILESQISRQTVRQLVGETEFPERLLKEAAGIIDFYRKSLCEEFAQGLIARPRVSPSLVDLVVGWSRDFADGDADADEYDEETLSLSFATMSLLWHTPRSTQAAMSLLSKLLDHSDRRIYQQAAVTVWKLAETRTETEYNPLIVRGLLECLHVRNHETRVGVLSELRTMLGLPSDAYEVLKSLARDQSLYPKIDGGFAMRSVYAEPEKVKEALITLTKTMKPLDNNTVIPDKSKAEQAQAPQDSREEMIRQAIQRWKDRLYDANSTKKLESIENVILEHLSRPKYPDDELSALALDTVVVDILFEVLGENGFDGTHLEELSELLEGPGTRYNILNVLAAYFSSQEDTLVDLASKDQKYYDGRVVPDVMFNSVAALFGGTKPIHRAVAGIIMNQHPRLPKCVSQILIDNLTIWEGSVRDRTLLYLATHWEHTRVFEMAMDKFGVTSQEGQYSEYPPQFCALIRDIARQAIAFPNVHPRYLKFWFMEVELKYPGSGIMQLILRLDEKSLCTVYEIWLEGALEESLCWYVNDNQLCVRTSAGVIERISESGQIISEFQEKMEKIKAEMGVPN
ncbi:peptidase C14 [Trichoderma harzianum]|uniref:Peptidase C14 n=1 Tax=Trichoderma harzianum TaxID=5544 RepID=A0A0F9X8E4_TRIHA|nr:peptidase C14 [Trichoderma harzianum]